MSSRRTTAIQSISLLCLLLALPVTALTSVRGYFIGNSLTDQFTYQDDFPVFYSMITAKGYSITAGRNITPGAPIQYRYENPSCMSDIKKNANWEKFDFGCWQTALRDNVWDYFSGTTLQ